MSRVRSLIARSQFGRQQAASRPCDWDCASRRFRVVTVTSSKGSVGKTTIAANLAIHLRELREDLPVLIIGLDDQPMLDRMFALGVKGANAAAAAKRGSFAHSIRLGRYGVHYVPSSRNVSELKQVIEDPYHLQRSLLRTDWQGLVIIDTKSDLEILTQNAIAASDLSIVVVKDHQSLIQSQRVFDFLMTLGRATRARVLLSLVNLRVKYREGESQDVLALLRSDIRRMGYPLFDTFLSHSPKIEALYTNPEHQALSIMHGASRSLVNTQMRQLAKEVLAARELRGTPEVTSGAESGVSVFLKPVTAAAAAAQGGRKIAAFPFRIGRLDPLVDNDLMIRDSPPFQVSRRHLELVEVNGRIGVLDRGSSVGALVNGLPLGGRSGRRGALFLNPPGGTIVLGNEHSPYAFKLVIQPGENATESVPAELYDRYDWGPNPFSNIA